MQVETTITDIGERAGNASLEEVVMALKIRPDIFKSSFCINEALLHPISKKICKIMRVKIDKYKPILGSNCFSHASGIHQDGILKNKHSNQLFYERKFMSKKSLGLIQFYLNHKPFITPWYKQAD